jgi:hypothetical protein
MHRQTQLLSLPLYGPLGQEYDHDLRSAPRIANIELLPLAFQNLPP